MPLLDSTLVRSQSTAGLPTGKSVLRFEAVTKRFGDVLANDAVSFEIESGVIHAIVGENGAGKSTLSKILCGYYRPDKGKIFLNDKELSFGSPSEARRAGIGMVHQQLALVPSLTGFENVVLGDQSVPFAFRRAALEKRVIKRAHQLGFDFNLSCSVSSLSVADRQKLEILKLLWRDSRILILDEPTSQLSPMESNDVLTMSESLAADGRIVILITHHINEVKQFAERVTVLRKGKCISSIKTATVDSDDLAKLMVDTNTPKPLQIANKSDGGSLVRILGVSTKASKGNRVLADINFELRAGEVVGIAGISGSGQNEFGRLIAGLLEPDNGRLMRVHTADQQGDPDCRNKNSARDHVCYIPSDQKQAYAPGLSIAANSFIREVNEPSSRNCGFIKTQLMFEKAKQLIDTFQITPGSPKLPASVLSGGNLQRLIIGRELSTKAKVVIADNPCAGLDISMSALVRNELRRAANDGRGVVLISPDLEELINTCNRIIVMFNGRIIGQQEAASFDYETLALLMGGQSSSTNTARG